MVRKIFFVLLLSFTAFGFFLPENLTALECCDGRRRVVCAGTGIWVRIAGPEPSITNCGDQVQDFFGTTCVDVNLYNCTF